MSSEYALFSGGHDSLAATHYAMENGHSSAVLHLDTNSGIPDNYEYVERVCEEFGWPLRIEVAPETLYGFAVEYGFPGSGAHSWAYRYFKERQLDRVATEVDSEPEFWTGVRTFESERRLRTVTGPHQPADRWVWRSPLYDWRDHQVEDYLRDHGLPRNPVVQTLHRSGECHCGAFASRNEELALLEAHYPEFAEWLLLVEERVQAEIGTDDPWCFWGHSGMPSPHLRALMAQHDTAQITLCDSCRVEEVVEA